MPVSAATEKSSGVLKWILILVLVLGFAGAGYWYFSGSKSEENPPAPPAPTEEPKNNLSETTSQLIALLPGENANVVIHAKIDDQTKKLVADQKWKNADDLQNVDELVIVMNGTSTTAMAAKGSGNLKSSLQNILQEIAAEPLTFEEKENGMVVVTTPNVETLTGKLSDNTLLAKAFSANSDIDFEVGIDAKSLAQDVTYTGKLDLAQLALIQKVQLVTISSTLKTEPGGTIGSLTISAATQDAEQAEQLLGLLQPLFDQVKSLIPEEYSPFVTINLAQQAAQVSAQLTLPNVEELAKVMSENARKAQKKAEEMKKAFEEEEKKLLEEESAGTTTVPSTDNNSGRVPRVKK